MANPPNFKTARYYDSQVVSTKFSYSNLYLRQIFSGPNSNQEKIADGNPTTDLGQTAVNNWEIYDGVGPNAALVARAQGMHTNSGSWFTAFNMVFEGGRFADSTLVVMGATTKKEGEWAIVGGTGEFEMARGVVARKVHGPITDGEIQELTISGVCTMKSKKPILTKQGPWGSKGLTMYDLEHNPQRLVTVTIRHRTAVEGMVVTYIDEDGEMRTKSLAGSADGRDTLIELGPYEYLMQVSGTINERQEVSSLTLTSNFKRYGPFGVPSGTSFSAPEVGEGRVVGFFASASVRAPEVFMASIGIYVASPLF